MRIRPLMIGAMSMTLAAAAMPAAARDLYKDVRASVMLEVRVDVIEDDVAAFTAAVMRNERAAWSGLTADDVVKATRGRIDELCDKANNPRLVDPGACQNYANQIVTVARREEDLRAFGRRLQALATREELPVEGLRGDRTDLAGQAQAILQIWQTSGPKEKKKFSDIVNDEPEDEEESETGTDIPEFRALPVGKSELETEISDIGASLSGLPREQLVAAVWRYRHGVRFVQGQRAPRFPAPTIDATLTGTERQWLLGSWPEIEGALLRLWERIQSEAAALDLQKNQYGVLLSLPVADDAEGLIGTVTVWGVVDQERDPDEEEESPDGPHPMGDVGLRWDIATEPVLPSLMAGSAIAGGAFPPSAEDGYGLCGNPLSAQGYLCRPLQTEKGPCEEQPEADGASITLTVCTKDELAVRTHSGPQMCDEFQWLTLTGDDEDYACILKPIDPATGREASSVYCSDACPTDSGVISSDVEWQTSGKRPDGYVNVCMRDNGNMLPFRYGLARGLAVADGVCGVPSYESVVTDPTKGCCRLVGEAYRVACQMMYDDGVFAQEDGSPHVSSEDIPFTMQTCAEALTQDFCEPLEECGASRNYKMSGENIFVDELSELAQASPAAEESCYDAVGDSIDPRNQAFIDAIDARDDVLRPGRLLTFTNTIGNHICAAGAYVEEAAKRHEIVGGRIPFGVFDQAYPWSVDGIADEQLEESDEEDDYLAIERLLTPLQGLTDAGGPLPSYRPAALAKTFDIALCGELGLPPHVPTELCMLDAQRRLNMPLMTAMMTAQRALQENDDLRSAAEDAQRGAAAVATRMINGYYGDYIHVSLRSLSDVLATTDDLLERLRLMTSPSLMCPGTDTPLLEGNSPLPPTESPTASFSSAPTR